MGRRSWTLRLLERPDGACKRGADRLRRGVRWMATSFTRNMRAPNSKRTSNAIAPDHAREEQGQSSSARAEQFGAGWLPFTGEFGRGRQMTAQGSQEILKESLPCQD